MAKCVERNWWYMDFIETILHNADGYLRRTGRPYVTLSYAQSLDGCITARAGESVRLSGNESMILTHRLRAVHDAILVGIGTVLSDDPRLNVRLVEGKNPRPVVVDSRLRLPVDARLLNGDSREPWVATREEIDKNRLKTLTEKGVRVLALKSNSRGQVCLGNLLDKLGELGVAGLMVEGGSRIITNFLQERLANYIVLTVAPVLVGGLHAVCDLGQSDPDRFPRIKEPAHTTAGDDLILWGELV
jgi:GTP cyclohydrolase II